MKAKWQSPIESLDNYIISIHIGEIVHWADLEETKGKTRAQVFIKMTLSNFLHNVVLKPHPF